MLVSQSMWCASGFKCKQFLPSCCTSFPCLLFTCCTYQDTIFAVKAPKGTTLEMPDPVEGSAMGEARHYRCVSTRSTRLLV